MDIIDKANLELERVEHLLFANHEQMSVPTQREREIDAFTAALDGISYLHTNDTLTDEQYDTVVSVLLRAAHKAASAAPLVSAPRIGDIGHRVGTQLTSFLFATDSDRNHYRDDLMGAEHEDKLQ